MWQAETLRITAFQLVPVDINEVSWWQEITGTEPEIDNLSRKVGERVQEGDFSNGRLRLSITPERIDWYFFPKPDEQDEYPLRLGNVADKLSEIKEIGYKWLLYDLKIKRLAFGVSFLSNQENHQATYQYLDKYLPSIKLDPEGSYDFMYQINRPRMVDLKSLEKFRINRLTRWNAIKGALKVQHKGQPVEKKFITARLETDVNTDSEYQDMLPNENLKDMLDLFVSFTDELQEKGDIA